MQGSGLGIAKKLTCLLGPALASASTHAQELSGPQKVDLLNRIAAIKRRMESAHVIEERILSSADPFGRISSKLAKFEIWSSPEKEHEICAAINLDVYTDRYGQYVLDYQNRRLTVIKNESSPLKSWIFPYDLQSLSTKNLKGFLEQNSYRLTSKSDTGFRGVPVSQRSVNDVTYWISKDLTPLRESSRVTIFVTRSPNAAPYPQGAKPPAPPAQVSVFKSKSDLGFKEYGTSNGIRYLQRATPSEGRDTVLSASFIPPTQAELSPDLLGPGLEILDRRGKAPVTWDKHSLIAANRGSSKIDTKRLLELTLAKALPLSIMRHAELMDRQLTLKGIQNDRHSLPNRLKRLFLVGGIICALVVAFVISARNALRQKEWGQS